MKIITDRYLTGHAQIDAYLVNTSSPFDIIIVYQPEMPFPELPIQLYAYAKGELPQEEFKDFMEKAYPGGFKRQFHYYLDNQKVSNFDFFCFVKTCLENRIWLDEVLTFVKEVTFEPEIQEELDDYIKEHNLQAY